MIEQNKRRLTHTFTTDEDTLNMARQKAKELKMSLSAFIFMCVTNHLK
jgi:hypothetical protein